VNYLRSKILIVGDKEYLETLRDAINHCTKRLPYWNNNEWAWYVDVIQYLHLNAKVLKEHWTNWYDAEFDSTGKHLIIHEICSGDKRSPFLDFIISSSNNQLTSYTILDSYGC